MANGRDPTTTDLASAADRFVTITNVLRSMMASMKAEIERGAASRAGQLARQRAAAAEDLRGQAERMRTRGQEDAREAAMALAGARAANSVYRDVTTEPLAVASHVRIGVAGKDVPVLIPLIGEANLQVAGDAQRRDVAGLLTTVLVRALTGCGPGQLAVTIVDPQLRGIHAPFAGLRSVDDSLLVPTITEEQGVDDLVGRLIDQHQRVAGVVRGTAGSLTALRRSSRQPVERYELVVFLDYPAAVSERTAAALANLMREAPKYGISILLQYCETPARPPWDGVTSSPAELISMAPRLSWSRLPDLAFRLDPAPADDEVSRVIGTIVESARTAAAPTLPLAELLPTAATCGTGRSAGGISVPVGKAGPAVVEIGLGDAIAQRHNVLVTGAVGQGKSNLLQIIVYGLAARYAPSEVELYLIDMREGVTFFPLVGSPDGVGWLPHARVVGVNTDREYAVSVLDFVVSQFETRAQALRQYDGTYTTFRERDNNPLPRIVLVIDEFQMLFERQDELADRAAATLEKLVRMGRGFGIHVILASQAVSHLPALGPRADVVFAQFPTRVALRNSRAESQVTLDRDNDEASRLRFRGEAIINHGFGRHEDNLRFVVAAADETALTRIRTTAWYRWRDTTSAPSAFDGRQQPGLDEVAPELQRLRHAATSPSAGRQALLGRGVSVDQEAVGAYLAQESGRHLAILGSGTSMAVGALQSAAISLALQHPDGNARFIILDQLQPEEAGLALLVDLLTRLGFPPEVHSGRKSAPVLTTLAEQVRLGQIDDPRYVIGFALDRAVDLDPGLGGADDPDALRDVLAGGPNCGIHLLGWWASPAVFERQRGFGDVGLPATLLALRMDLRTAKDLMGAGSDWTGTDNRGLLYAPRESGTARLAVPFAPLDQSRVNAILRADWDLA
jgi:S-DNA-T family DNA segregation ATPase FtsK/SpoIIIE